MRPRRDGGGYDGRDDDRCNLTSSTDRPTSRFVSSRRVLWQLHGTVAPGEGPEPASPFKYTTVGRLPGESRGELGDRDGGDAGGRTMTSPRTSDGSGGSSQDRNHREQSSRCGLDASKQRATATLIGRTDGDLPIDLAATLPKLHELLLMLRVLKQKRGEATIQTRADGE